MKEIISQSPEQTQELARRLGLYIREQHLSCAIALTGALGCGKTCFVQGLARGLGVGTSTISPAPPLPS